MDIYEITVGEYEDRITVGYALTPEEADGMVTRATVSGAFRAIEIGCGGGETYQVTGPYRVGQLYDSYGKRF